jgi:hypothetical protein
MACIGIGDFLVIRLFLAGSPSLGMAMATWILTIWSGIGGWWRIVAVA